MRLRLPICAIACLLAAGCNPFRIIENVTSVSMPSLLYAASGERARIVVPDTVAVGAAFKLQVTTFDPGCGVRPDRTEVASIAVDTVAVTPYDLENDVFACGGEVIRFFTHDASITFNQPGRAIIKIVGDSTLPGHPIGRAPTSIILPIIVH